MKKNRKINGKRLAGLRGSAGLSQKVLAAKVGCDSRTVSRWELGEIDHVREDKFGKLCSVLKTTEAVLCGEGPLPNTSTSQDVPQKGQMNLNIDPACRNSLTLVAFRYGVTRQQIVESAPLLFDIAAKEYLQDRQKRLHQLRGAADELLTSHPSHLPVKAPIDFNALDSEQRSIEKRDLFATLVAEELGSPYDQGDDDWDEGEQNPFAVFLRDRLAKVCGPEASRPFRWYPGGSPEYQICAEEASNFVGDDPEATSAILTGVAPLHEMPQEIRKGSPTDRAAWAQARAQRNARDVASLSLDDLFDNPDDKGDRP
jgi:transcriptional regulator with XRE-family HTH domain